MPRTAFLFLALLSVAPSCVIASGSFDSGRTGVRLDYATYSDFDGNHRDDAFLSMPTRTEADFETDAVGVTVEHRADDWIAVFGSLRAHDVQSRSGSMSLDDGFQEIGLGARAYLPADGPVTAFGQFELVFVTGLDPAGAGTVFGVAFGVGAVWALHDNLGFELLGRLLLAGDGDSERPWEEQTEVDGTELLLGVTYWF